MRWDPPTMMRATRELGNKFFRTERQTGLDCIDCSDWSFVTKTESEFFRGYTRNAADNDHLLKVKDWPDSDAFRQRLQRHYQVSMTMNEACQLKLVFGLSVARSLHGWSALLCCSVGMSSAHF